MPSDVEAAPESVSDEQLMATVLRGAATPERTAALKTLLRRRSAQVRPILGKIVNDAAAPSELRTTAAVAVGREATTENEESLRLALDDKDPAVVATAADGLARIGGRASLESLAIAGSKMPAAGRAAAFARTLISYRLGLGTDRLPEPPTTALLELDRERAEPVPVEEVAPEAFRAARPWLERELPTIPVSEQGSVRMRCGNEHLWVVLGDDMVRTGGQAAAQTDRVAAVVLKESSCPGGWYVREYILAHPRADGAAVFGVVPGGRVVHFGALKLDQAAASLQLRAVEAPGVRALELAAELQGAGGRLVIREALTGSSRRLRQVLPSRPRPSAPPRARPLD
jgi:hypothetical protein